LNEWGIEKAEAENRKNVRIEDCWIVEIEREGYLFFEPLNKL